MAAGTSTQTMAMVLLACVPGRQVFKIKRAKVMSAEIQQVIDGGCFESGPGQLEE